MRPGTAISTSCRSERASGSRATTIGPVPRAHARPVRKDDVPLLHERIRVQRDRRHLEPALERPLVQGLDVSEDVLELEPARVDLAPRRAPRT